MNAKHVDVVGNTSGALTIIKEVEPRRKNGQISRRVVCKCSCGTEREYFLRSIVGIGRLTKSCGCMSGKAVAISNKKRAKHGLSSTLSYQSWMLMRDRCLNKSSQHYANYGGRGITICKEWAVSVEAFIADMGERSKGTTIDRIDNSKGYFKENCRWANPVQQQNNRRSNRILEALGKQMTISQWSRETGISGATITRRLTLGWGADESVTRSVR